MSEATLFPEPPAAPQPASSHDAFDAFWAAFPHRLGSRPKRLARMYFVGRKRLIDETFITPDDWMDIQYGAVAQSELYVRDGTEKQYWVNVATWLYQGRWEGATEDLEQRQAEGRQAHQRATERRRRDRWTPPTPEERREDDERARRMLAERANGSGDHENVIGLPRKVGAE